ncbi:MAG: alkaline phosphatase family protein [Bacteriovoracaceae bacterium]|nr:alkaline phosphatase family protein [Bacteriovoracaceae bacterium]
MKKTVLILADAFRNDYLDRGVTPFLDKEKINAHYVRKIVPGNGFCERSEIFTGKHPAETGFFTAIDLSKEKNIYSRFSPLLNILNIFLKIFPSILLEKVLRRLIWEIVSKTKYPMHPYKIPLNILKYFTLTEDKVDMRKKGALGCLSIFDYIEQNGGRYFYDSFTALNIAQKGDDHYRINIALENADEAYSHYFIYLSELDAIGHKYGPESKEINKAIHEMDQKIEYLIQRFKTKAPDTQFIILGDHGMVEVEQKIDAISILNNTFNKYPISLGKDYLYFLDSTLVRIWIKDNSFKAQVLNEFRNNNELKTKGQFITKANAIELQIPYTSESPDLIWWAKSGTLVSPDFFHRREEGIKGMHGYDNSYDSSKGFCIVTGEEVKPKFIEQEHLTSVFKKLKGEV